MFPRINERSRFPKQVINMKQTPDASEFWIAGLEGKVKRVSRKSGNYGKGVASEQIRREQKEKYTIVDDSANGSG